MKKRRRIEITAFRRRTTIVLRDRSEFDLAGRPNDDDKASHQPRADPARAEEIDPDRNYVAGSAAASLGLIKDANDRKST